VKFAFIESEKAQFPVSVLCEVLGVSRSGFYAWRGRPESARLARDQELGTVITEIHKRSRGTYGSPRVHAALRADDVRVGKKRVARLMQEQGLESCRKRRFRALGTQTDESLPVARNILSRQFKQNAPNVVWVGDTTYISTAEGWLYLAVLLDLHSRRVVGWAMSDTNDRALVLSALQMAAASRCPGAGLLHHSDRGSQYASQAYREALKRLGFVCSMSRKGNCWDNAVAESFFGTLKSELLDGAGFANRLDARQAIFEYIEVFYNRQRAHSGLNFLSPEQFESKFLKTA
jgi:transposase InsO family protein